MNSYMSAKIQKLSLINEPWPHAVCDDFLPEDIFGSVYQVAYDNVITSNKIEGNETTPIIRIGEDESVIGAKLKTVALKELHETLDSVDFKKMVLEKFSIYMDCVKAEDLLTSIRMRGLTSGYKYAVHKDGKIKVFACIVYIDPDNPSEYLQHDLGTKIYTSKMRQYGAMSWKVNRALMFAPSEMSWHGYSVPESFEQKRVTLLVNYKLPVEKYYQRSKDNVYIEPERKIRKVYDYNGYNVALLSEESFSKFESRNKK